MSSPFFPSLYLEFGAGGVGSGFVRVLWARSGPFLGRGLTGNRQFPPPFTPQAQSHSAVGWEEAGGSGVENSGVR